MDIKLSKESVLHKKKPVWGMVLGAIVLIAACVAAYNITKLPEKNVRFQVIQNPSA